MQGNAGEAFRGPAQGGGTAPVCHSRGSSGLPGDAHVLHVAGLGKPPPSSSAEGEARGGSWTAGPTAVDAATSADASLRTLTTASAVDTAPPTPRIPTCTAAQPLPLPAQPFEGGAAPYEAESDADVALPPYPLRSNTT